MLLNGERNSQPAAQLADGHQFRSGFGRSSRVTDSSSQGGSREQRMNRKQLPLRYKYAEFLHVPQESRSVVLVAANRTGEEVPGAESHALKQTHTLLRSAEFAALDSIQH